MSKALNIMSSSLSADRDISKSSVTKMEDLQTAARELLPDFCFLGVHD